MVQAVFIVENLFVSGLGAFLSYALALTFAYNLYLQVAADQGLAFLPPWLTLTGIGLAVFGVALLTAWLHARQGAKVVIAEALSPGVGDGGLVLQNSATRLDPGS